MKQFYLFSALLLNFLFFAQPVAAVVNPFDICDQNIDPVTGENLVDDSSVCAASQDQTTLFGPNSIWNNILNTITFVIGAIAVLMIVIGALRYALSSGEQAAIVSAKNTILYAVIALVVAVMANAIVNFVLTNI